MTLSPTEPPMDHQAVLAALPPETRAGLAEVTSAEGLRHLALHLGLIALGIAGMASPLWPLALVPLGLALTFLFTLEHECTHRTPFRGALSDWVGRASGLVLILPFEWFRWFHMAHHRHTNQPGDPELEGARARGARALAWQISGLPYWRAEIALLLRLAAGRAEDCFLPKGARPRAVLEARAMLALYALGFLLAPKVLIWFWVLPMLVGQPFLRLYLMAEHGDCPQVADMLANTRTTFTNRIVRFLAWNMPYHAEHHALPTVPFHRLPALHGLMRAHLKVTAEGYAAFTRDYLARRL